MGNTRLGSKARNTMKNSIPETQRDETAEDADVIQKMASDNSMQYIMDSHTLQTFDSRFHKSFDKV